ncbi:hypothetical protein PFISCL1PPCAC_9356, partial [Pristionchus fissidentatus]
MNILDVVLTSHPNLVKNCRVLPPLPKLDHALVVFSLDAATPSFQTKLIRDFRNVNWEPIQSAISNIDWDTVLSSVDQNADTLYSTFLSHVLPIMDYFIPYRKLSRSRTTLTSKSLRLLRISNRKYKSDKLKDQSSNIPALVDPSGAPLIDDQDKAKLLANHFSKCYNHNLYTPPQHPPPSNGPFIDYVAFSPMIIARILRKLPNRNSTSPHDIPWIQAFLSNRTQMKTVIMHLGTNHPSCTHSALGIDLPIKLHIKDLGITYDNKLSFTKHFENIIGKASARCSFIHRSFISKSPALYSKLFCTYVRPLLEFCCELWNPSTITNISRLENVLHRFTRIVFRRCDLPATSYHNRLVALKIPFLCDRRTRIDLRNSRGHRLKICPFTCNTVRFNRFFSNRIVHHWNRLDDDIVSNSS